MGVAMDGYAGEKTGYGATYGAAAPSGAGAAVSPGTAGAVTSSVAAPASTAPQEDVWTIKRCLEWSEGYLGRHGEERPRLAAEWLLCAAVHKKRIELYVDFNQPMTMEERSVVREGLRRRVAGEPLQYITGETAFRQLDIICEPGVLIPRPETELLCEFVLDYIDRTVLHRDAEEERCARAALPWNAEVERLRAAEEAARAAEPGSSAAGSEAGELPGQDDEADALPAPEPRTARVFEVGCGTGCISLSLAAERPGRVTCVATDVEPRAISLAERNRERAGIAAGAVEVREGDLVRPMRPEERETFDVLVSNPPYIPSGVMATLPREVSAFEPHLALDGGADGLDVFRRLLDAAPDVLRQGGLFACELFEDATEPAAELCRQAGMADVRVASDLTGRPRFVLAQLP